MSCLCPRAITFQGQVVADGEVGEVFLLFSPGGEKLWVPGWEPEFLYPSGTDWAQGQIFRTREETGEAVWIVTRLDHAQHTVEYHRVEPRRYVARIEVNCRPTHDHRTRVAVAYSFIGLSEKGNQEIDAMTQHAYDAKMGRWTAWINNHLASRGR